MLWLIKKTWRAIKLDLLIKGVKKRWSKLVKGEKKSLFTLEQKDMDIITRQLQGEVFEQDTSAEQQNQN
ncbi:MAG: hypothetical protein GOVbin1629_54 [Prokaryotic dsDNA virus sp.]|nr:MAG: hypothetical protein GOVbin1629_54 [Prokaryotic dsDNA virus sp.]